MRSLSVDLVGLLCSTGLMGLQSGGIGDIKSSNQPSKDCPAPGEAYPHSVGFQAWRPRQHLGFRV